MWTLNAHLASVILAYLTATASAQQLNFGQITVAPTVASDPTNNGLATQTASLITTISSPTAVFSASATQANKRNAVEVKKRGVVTSSETWTGYGAAFGWTGVLTTINPGALLWFNGGCTHNIMGNLINSGSLVISQTSYLSSNPGAGGQTIDWIGHDVNDGVLMNGACALVQLNDIGSASAPTYDWQIHNVANNGTIQMAGRGDTGRGNFQVVTDNDSVNNGVISYEQTGNNYGTLFSWHNAILAASSATGNLYNNGAFRLVNVVFQNIQNVYGNGCWVLGQGSTL